MLALYFFPWPRSGAASFSILESPLRWQDEKLICEVSLESGKKNRHTNRVRGPKRFGNPGADIWWCPGRLLNWMPPYKILVLSSGLWWSLLLYIRSLRRHNMTSYSRFLTNVLAKFI